MAKQIITLGIGASDNLTPFITTGLTIATPSLIVGLVCATFTIIQPAITFTAKAPAITFTIEGCDDNSQ